tara:strand:- start:4890 stop:5186 length:297 start_codon:yes stop_codon:yes gene_type:complete
MSGSSYDAGGHRYREITVVAKLRMRKVTETQEQYRILNRALAEAVDTHGGEELVDFYGEVTTAHNPSLEHILKVTKERLAHGEYKYHRTEKGGDDSGS